MGGVLRRWSSPLSWRQAVSGRDSVRALVTQSSRSPGDVIQLAVVSDEGVELTRLPRSASVNLLQMELSSRCREPFFPAVTGHGSVTPWRPKESVHVTREEARIDRGTPVGM